MRVCNNISILWRMRHIHLFLKVKDFIPFPSSCSIRSCRLHIDSSNVQLAPVRPCAIAAGSVSLKPDEVYQLLWLIWTSALNFNTCCQHHVIFEYPLNTGKKSKLWNLCNWKSSILSVVEQGVVILQCLILILDGETTRPSAGGKAGHCHKHLYLGIKGLLPLVLMKVIISMESNIIQILTLW